MPLDSETEIDQHLITDSVFPDKVSFTHVTKEIDQHLVTDSVSPDKVSLTHNKGD